MARGWKMIEENLSPYNRAATTLGTHINYATTKCLADKQTI